MNIDELVSSRKSYFSVNPARVGMRPFQQVKEDWTPVFTGVTTFCETFNIDD
jgi:hypothetical protein